MISLALSTRVAFLLALWCLAVTSADDDNYPVVVGGKTASQEILNAIWKIPFFGWAFTLVMSVLNTVYTFVINAVLTPPALILGIKED
jgi:hypothetical protein